MLAHLKVRDLVVAYETILVPAVGQGASLKNSDAKK
jgi:hypothetical protein